MPTLDDQRRAAGLNAIDKIVPAATEAKPDVVTEDATIGNEERLRGIPAVGRVSGTMKGTRPGDSAKALDDEGHELVRQRMALARKRMKDHR